MYLSWKKCFEIIAFIAWEIYNNHSESESPELINMPLQHLHNIVFCEATRKQDWTAEEICQLFIRIKFHSPFLPTVWWENIFRKYAMKRAWKLYTATSVAVKYSVFAFNRIKICASLHPLNYIFFLLEWGERNSKYTATKLLNASLGIVSFFSSLYFLLLGILLKERSVAVFIPQGKIFMNSILFVVFYIIYIFLYSF